MYIAFANFVGSLISAIGGASESAATNATNLKIAQMNNEFNEKMLNKQMDYNKEMYQTQLGDQWEFYDDQKQNEWDLVKDNQAFNTDMWDKQNEYNSAAAQVERFKAAGLNPALMMQGQSAGIAQSVSGTKGNSPSGSSPSAQGVNPPTASQWSADYSGIAQGLQSAVNYAQRERMQEAQIQQIGVATFNDTIRAMAEVMEKGSSSRNKDALTETENFLRNIKGAVMESQAGLNNANQKVAVATERAKIAEAMQTEKFVSFMDQTQQLQVSKSLAEIKVLLDQGELTKKQAEHEIYKMGNTIADTYFIKNKSFGQNIENRFNQKTFKQRVQKQLFNFAEGNIWTVGANLLGGSVRKFLNNQGLPTIF